MHAEDESMTELPGDEALSQLAALRMARLVYAVPLTDEALVPAPTFLPGHPEAR